MNDCSAIEGKAGKYLTFCLASEDYGIPILKVREIIGMMPITTVPRMPAFVKGVINLRGKVVPVVDLRLKFGLQKIDYGERTCIVVVEIAGETGTRPAGVIVDSVSEVIAIKDEDIEDTAEFGATVEDAFVSGMARKDGAIKILLDIDAVAGTGKPGSAFKAA